MNHLQDDNIFSDEGHIPRTGIDAFVNIKADPSVLIVKIYQLEMRLQGVIGRGDE